MTKSVESGLGLRARCQAHLHAVALPRIVASRKAWVVHRRSVKPAEKEVEVVLVEHRGNPHGIACAELLDVGAAKYRAGKIPVRGIGVNIYRAWCLYDPEPDIFRLGRKRREGDGGENECKSCNVFHMIVFRNYFFAGA